MNMGKSLSRWLIAIDVLSVFGSFLLSFYLRYGTFSRNAAGSLGFYLVPAGFTAILWWMLAAKQEITGFRGGWSFPVIASKIVTNVLVLMVSLLALGFIAQQNYSRLLLGYFAGIFTLVIFLTRLAIREVITSPFRERRKLAILGHGRVAREFAAKISNHPELMWDFVGFLFPAGEESVSSRNGNGENAGISTLGVIDLLREKSVDDVIVCVNQPDHIEIRKLIDDCRKAAINVSLVPQSYELYLTRPTLVDVDGLPLLCLNECAPRPVSVASKRVFDLALAPVLGVVSLLPVLVCAAILRITTGRAFRAEKRCGRNGVEFDLYRLNVDRNSPSSAGFKMWLDRLSVAELPQLWNVLKGDMSLVGPRPEPMERAKHYSEWQRQRLRIQPGITGIAQVHGLREYHLSEEKCRFDLQYLSQSSRLFDLALLIQTVCTLVVRMWTRSAGNISATAKSNASPESRPNVSPEFPLRPATIPEVVNVDRSQSCAD
jgi:lipopolysaccharide/colanic/teichoic acid biosynthesis glycosyltransferase